MKNSIKTKNEKTTSRKANKTNKKKRKKGHYKTGTYLSKKCSKPIKYRSYWECIVCQWLDLDDTVEKFHYEDITIPYISNIRTGKIRKYYPDFLILYKDGTKKMVEVKQKRHLNNSTVKKKAEFAKLWCKQNGAEYEFWTDSIIKSLRIITESKNKQHGKQ